MLHRVNAAYRRISAEFDALQQCYPDHWIAMNAKKGVLAAADTKQELRRKAADLGYSLDGVAVQQMNTKPAPRIFIT